MNKNLIIGLVIGGLVLAGGGYWLLNRSSTSPQNDAVTETGKSPEMEKKSFKDLLAIGSNQQCTFADQESGSSGRIYTGNGNARGDFDSQAEGSKSTSHMIVDSKHMYIWTDQEAKGFKMSRDSVEKVQKNLPTNNPKTVDINKKVDYKCSSWSVDASVFVPPSTMQFEDYSAMMEEAQKMMDDSGAVCDACKSLPEDAKAQCKAALKCE